MLSKKSKAKPKRKGGSCESWTHQENEFVRGIYYGDFWRKSKGIHQSENKQLSPAIKKKIAGMADLYLSEMEEMSRNGGGFLDYLNPMKWGKPIVQPTYGEQAYDYLIEQPKNYVSDVAQRAFGSAPAPGIAQQAYNYVVGSQPAQSYLGSVGSYLSSAAASAAAYASSAAASIASYVSAALSGVMASASALILSTPGLAFLSLAAVAALGYAMYKYAKSPAAAQDRLAKSLRAQVQRIEGFLRQLATLVRSSNQANNRDLIQYLQKASEDVFEIKQRIMNVPDNQEPLQAAEALATLATIETNLGAIPAKIQQLQSYQLRQFQQPPPQYQQPPPQYQRPPPAQYQQPSAPPPYQQQEQSYQSQMALQERQKQMEEQRLLSLERQAFMDAQLKQQRDYEAYAEEMRSRNQAPPQIPQVYEQTVDPVMNPSPLVAGVSSSLDSKPMTPIFKIKAPF